MSEGWSGGGTSGPDDDDDADGVPALVEHFLGISDQDSNQGRGRYAMSSAVTLPGDGLDYPTFEVTYAIGADDVVGRVDWSDTLLSWGQSMVLVSDVPNGDGTATMVWRSTHSTAISPQLFRLNVVLP